jgi:hypothetical protein
MGGNGSVRGNIARAAFGVSAVLCLASPAHASVEISTAATSNMSCSGGVCSPTAKKAVLNVNDLTTMLASGDVKVTTGAGAVTITIAAPFSWTSTSRLTLDAIQTVSFRAPVTVAGTGAVTITYNDGGTDGDLIFFPGASLDFWDLGSSLIINGSSFALANGIKSLADDIAANPHGFYALAGDLDLARHGSYRGSPIKTDFWGTFEGLGHTVGNLSINHGRRGGEVGLFSFVGSVGAVRDINLDNVNVSAAGGNGGVGALVGNSNGSIINASASGTVAGGAFTGGLAGAVFTKMVNSSAAVVVYGGSGTHKEFGAIGGLVGNAGNGCTISQSHATGAVYGGAYVRIGGLVGAGFATISQSYATGSVTGEGDTRVGGLMGSLESTVANSYSTGAATSAKSTYIGGLFGEIKGTQQAPLTIEASYSTGTVEFSTTKVGRLSGDSYLGGFVGNDSAHTRTIADAYWNLDTSSVGDPSQGAGNIKDDPGITGLTDTQMKSGLHRGLTRRFGDRARASTTAIHI